MKKNILLFLLLLLNFIINAQIDFEKGYYISNDNQKIECLIKNIDWKNNPTEFKYKLSESKPVKKLTIENVKEFGIYEVTKFIRANVEIDISSEVTKQLSYNRHPEFIKKQYFLKVLVEGEANLYLVQDKNIVKYFFSTNANEIEQLVFKTYINTDKKIVKNENYKQQLFNQLNCENIAKREIENLNYRRKELTNYFKKFNQCENSEVTILNTNNFKDIVNVNIKTGLNFSSVSISNPSLFVPSTDFSDQLSFRFGIESEFIFPFHKNKWSAFIEPTFQYFTGNAQVDNENLTVKYNNIEIPVGIRHYFYLNKTSKIFINTAIVANRSFQSIANYRNFDDFELTSNRNFIYGLGYNHNDKFIAELRYFTEKTIFYDYVYWNSDFKTIALVLGYNIY